jgi:hypothetical protein
MQLQITAEIEAVKFRPLNSFEWAVLEILSSFTDHPPTTLEAAESLCLHEPCFLKAAVESLTKIRAIQQSSEENSDSDLQNYVLSESGKEVLHNEGWEDGRPETRPEEFKLEWPSAKIVSGSETKQAKNKHVGTPSSDDVKHQITHEELERWMNFQGSELWKVKNFYITGVERY